MNKSSNVTAIVLAAGTSSRMGTSKQLLPLNGKPLLEAALENVRASNVSEIVVVLGHAAEAIQQAVRLEGAQIVLNTNYSLGMGTSLRAAIPQVAPRSTAVIVVLADQPLVQSSTLDRLIGEHATTHAQIVIPTYRGFRGNPILLDRSVFADLIELSGDMGCRAIFGDHPDGIVKLPVDDVGILLDIDRPADFEKLRNEDVVRSHIKEVEESEPTSERKPDIRPEIVIVGRDDVAKALAGLAHLLKFSVTMVDPLLLLAEVPAADRALHILDFFWLPANADRQVVVASRGAWDEEAVEQAMAVRANYVALVASRKRGEEIIRSLRRKGIDRDRLKALKVPAGLEIGATRPEEIALSIIAEIVAERNKLGDRRTASSDKA